MICCGHILSNPYKEEEFPDPGRLAMNRHQRAEEMCNIGNYEEYVSTSLIVLQRYPGIERQRERERTFIGICCYPDAPSVNILMRLTALARTKPRRSHEI